LKSDNRIISDDPQKPEIFNYFSTEMTISDNSDGLPILPRITYLTDDRLYSDTAEESDKILKYLRQSKQI